MAFTRQHYKAIAEIIKQERESTPGESQYEQGKDHATYNITLELINMFASDNERFDRSKFMVACGIE